MGKLDITESFIYRHRYVIGYSLVAISLITVLLFAGLYLPGGISAAEMQSVVKSDSISLVDFNSIAVTNLPYHLLQQATLSIFGVTILGIKLPSIILAFLSAIGIVLLLRKWFKPSVGVLASLIAITTGQFLFISQNGTPGVLYLFWAVWLIYLATLLTTNIRFKTPVKFAFFTVAALSLYTPLSIYMLIAMLTAFILHPHLRYLIRQLSRPKLVIGTAIAIVLITPLIFATVKNLGLGLELLGIPTKWPDFAANFNALGAQYLGFASPGGITLMTPFFELGSMLLICIGLFRVIRAIAAARSYIILIWILCLVPVVIFNPSFTSIVFLPMVLLLAYGLGFLLSYWYGLFPRNPYARIGGLVPMIILVTVLVFSGADRYVYGYRYDPNLVPNFSEDIKLIPKNTSYMVVSANEKPFYDVVAKHGKMLTVTTAPQSDGFLATREAKKAYPGYVVQEIITTHNKDNGDRFYLYKKITD
ncbi:MAG: glycosyltransferase family 39 protein [Candidatus Saccharibacteria bacterium]